MNLMKAGRRPIIQFLMLAILLVSWAYSGSVQSVKAQSTEVKYFPETGHNVREDFLQFYLKAKDPTLVFGYPITETFTSKDGKTVQYFQRARFELDRDILGNPRVQVTSIGQRHLQLPVSSGFVPLHKPFARHLVTSSTLRHTHGLLGTLPG